MRVKGQAMNTTKAEYCLWHFSQQELESGSEFLEQQCVHEFCYFCVNFDDWKCACNYIWILMLVSDWEQTSQDESFTGKCPEASSLWLLPLRSTKHLFKINGNATWKVCAWYQHRRKNTLMGFAWSVSHHSTALLAPKSCLPSRYHAIFLSRTSNGDILQYSPWCVTLKSLLYNCFKAWKGGLSLL